jgi:AraC family ethanolamine operon transcriptional activator
MKNPDRGKKSHEYIIKLSIDFLKSNSCKPIHVLDLCSALNVRMRTLYYAFQEFYGVSPIRYLRLVRYARARRDLLIADPENTTVTDVAAKWRFWHFGRFSIEYKSLFGESPSETLNNEKKLYSVTS